MGTGLLDTGDFRVRDQIKAMYPSTLKEPITLPDNLAEHERYAFELGDVQVEVKDPSGQYRMVMVPVTQYVTGRLPRYKAQGPDGIRYEHYLDMPAELLELYVHHSLNDFLPDGFRQVFSSGLQLAGDKEKKDENGVPLARPIVIPTAIGESLHV